MKSLPAPKPGIHYVVVEPCKDASYITFPNVPETSIIRHRWILVRKIVLDVPQPTRTPMLKKNMEADERALILNLYFRPWTLLQQAATPCVPHMKNLEISVTCARAQLRRLRGKQPYPLHDNTQRSLTAAWNDYREHHIASKHSTTNNVV